jgi:hypothetical protein
MEKKISLNKDQFRTFQTAIGTTIDYINYPHTHKGTTLIRKANEKAQELINNLIKTELYDDIFGDSIIKTDLGKKEYESLFKNSLQLLRDLADLQNGAPLEKYRDEWEETIQEVYNFLNEHEEK